MPQLLQLIIFLIAAGVLLCATVYVVGNLIDEELL